MSPTIHDRMNRLRVAVGIATAGRPLNLKQTLRELTKQQRPPDVVVVCASSNADLGDVRLEFPAVVTLFAGRGLAQKRNAILRHLSDFDVLIFLDDDFLVDPDYVAATEAAFASDDAIAMTTGEVIADGVCGPGLDVIEARRRFAGCRRRLKHRAARCLQRLRV